MKPIIDVYEEESGFSGKSLKYSLSLPLNGGMKITNEMSESELNTLLDDITKVLGYKEIIEKFDCSVTDAKEIKRTLDWDSDCRDCPLRMKECFRCRIVCESPLEKKLLKALVLENVNVELQLRINKDGSISHYPEPVNPETILTLPDFYIETEDKKICIYTDGHTYHERTEYQAVRDRSIDRTLQELGFMVLRFTTSEINQKLEQSVENIKRACGFIKKEESEVEKGETENSNSNETTEIQTKGYDGGYCIRCGTEISFNPDYSLCSNCYRTWAEFGDENYREHFCHACRGTTDYISKARPLCQSCYGRIY